MAAEDLRASRPKSLAEFAYQTLLERIATGRYRPGDRLVIDSLAKELAVSLIPVREALARLNAEGLVEHHPNRGYILTPAPPTKDYRELFLARLVVEAGAVKLSESNISDSALEALRAINRRLAALKPSKTFRGFRRFVELNDKFHAELVGLARNKTLTDLHQKLAYGARIARDLQGRGVPDLAENVREHDAIIKALELREVNLAAKAVEDHILAGMERFLHDLQSRKSTD